VTSIRAISDDGIRSKRRLSRPFKVFSIAITALVGAVAVYPLIRVALRVITENGEFTLAPLGQLFDVPAVGQIVLNTVIVVALSSVLAMVVGGVLAYLNERTDARMGMFTDSLPLITYLVPPLAGSIGWALLLSPSAGLLNGLLRSIGVGGAETGTGPLNIFSWPGLIFVYTLYAIPYAFMTISAGLRNCDTSLEEQARVSGDSLMGTLWRVTIPSIRPALGGALILMVTQGLALISVPLIIGTGADIDVLALVIVDLLNFSYPPRMVQAVGLTLIMIVLVMVAWIAQNRILRSARFGTVGGKGQRFELIRLRTWRPAARGLFILYGLLGVALPVVALVIVSLQGFWSATINWQTLTIDWFVKAVFGTPQTMTALGNSFTLAVAGASIGMLIAAIASVLIARNRTRWANAIDGAIKLPSVVSHIVIGVGMILAFAGPPFNLGGTLLILLIAYLIVYLAQGSVSTDAAVAQVGADLAEASAVAGAGYGRTFFRVYMPLILPAMVAGWAYLFARMAGDLTVTALLGSPSNVTIGYLLMQISHNGSYGQLAPIAIVLTAMSAVVVITVITVANHWSRRRNKQMQVITNATERVATNATN